MAPAPPFPPALSSVMGMPRAPPTRSTARRLVGVLAVLIAARGAQAQSATVCATNQLDWYTSVVGESPCRTYERLRQICDSRYVVGEFNRQTPGDSCDSQLHSCCCNSIAWNLSMLCMNCQHAGNTTADTIGIDAGTGAYGLYLANCGVPTNGSLPANIQADICTQEIDLRSTLYDPMWVVPRPDSGAWYYTFFRGVMEGDFAKETGKNLTSCSVASSSSTPVPTSTSALTLTSVDTIVLTTISSGILTFTATITSISTTSTIAPSVSSDSSIPFSSISTLSSGPSTFLSTFVSTATTSGTSTSILSPHSGILISTFLSSSLSSYMSSSTRTPSPHALDVGAVAGGAAGGGAALLLALLVGMCWRHRRRSRQKLASTIFAPATHTAGAPALEPFVEGATANGEHAPPPYAESPHNGVPPLAALPPSAHAWEHAGAPHEGEVAGASLYGGSTFGVVANATRGGPSAGLSDARSAELGGARRVREKESGWRVSDSDQEKFAD